MSQDAGMGVRRFGKVNWLGLYTLCRREVLRFLNVWSQTLMAPLINAGLFLLIFTIAIGSQRGDVMGVPFMHFLAPGILTMTVIQNAFANSSSSLTSAKVQGNIVDTLMPPLSAGELVTGYIAGAVARGLNKLSHVNPFFYIIDGVRFGMIGVSDGSPWRGLWVAILACAVVTSICWYWFKRGYRLKA
ncbi:MAG: hypothetical protein EBR05_02670 [Marivivens sp.]|nr:hypothetical protein [Marivivens sp.]